MLNAFTLEQFLLHVEKLPQWDHEPCYKEIDCARRPAIRIFPVDAAGLESHHDARPTQKLPEGQKPQDIYIWADDGEIWYSNNWSATGGRVSPTLRETLPDADYVMVIQAILDGDGLCDHELGQCNA